VPTDRVIHWPAQSPDEPVNVWKVPTNEALGTLCKDYARGIATSVRWSGGRWYINLPGTPSNALEQFYPRDPSTYNVKRWIEVWCGGDEHRYTVYVMTRGQDDITNAVAEGLADIIARHWRGARDPA
jgi:hypothetical protein